MNIYVKDLPRFPDLYIMQLNSLGLIFIKEEKEDEQMTSMKWTDIPEKVLENLEVIKLKLYNIDQVYEIPDLIARAPYDLKPKIRVTLYVQKSVDFNRIVEFLRDANSPGNEKRTPVLNIVGPKKQKYKSSLGFLVL